MVQRRPSEEMATIDAFNDRLRAGGHWVFAGGLSSPATATVIEAPDAETAHLLAAEGSLACQRRVEVRAFLG